MTGWGDKKIIVGGLGASSQFAVLDKAEMSAADSRTPYEVIKETFGSDLVWSVHTYPGWFQENHTVEDWYQTWQDNLFLIASDQILLTEVHTRDGSVNSVVNGDASESLDNSYARALDWFGENGIGISWWPVSLNQNNFSSQALLDRKSVV